MRLRGSLFKVLMIKNLTESIRFIDHQEIFDVLHIEDLIPEMRRVMIDFSMGRVEQPIRRMIDVGSHGGYFGSMPASSGEALGAKMLTFYPGNAKRNLPTHMALIVLFRPETGEPMVVMDGHYITQMRTAAVTAVFVDAVAAEGAKSLAILGAGAQGRCHLQALSRVRDFNDIRIWNRTHERAVALAESWGGKAMTCEEAIRGAEVVVVATSSKEPVLDGQWLRPGVKLATVGWSGANGSEVDATTMSHTVLVDSREGTRADSGNVRCHNAKIHSELGHVLAGSVIIDPDATVIFDSIGMACQDLAAACLVLEKLEDQ